MPKKKSAASSVAVKKPRIVKKSVTRTIHPKKKTRPVLIDVIEDEPMAEAGWPMYKDDSAEEKKAAPVTEKEVVTESVSDPEEITGLAPLKANNTEEIDNQKKYFADLASELSGSKETALDAHTEAAKPGTDKRRSIGLYRHLVIKFIILVAILAAVVLYFSFSKLTVILNLKGESVSDTMLLNVADPSLATASTSSAFTASNDPREKINGSLKELNASVTKSYPASGETYLGEAIIGQVTLINNSPKSQALVATTRLLSQDNKLFRIKNAVVVPANGQVVTDIYSDAPAADMAIEPTTFTIPGLWLGLQDKIFAKSNAAFVFSKQVLKYVTSEDLSMASKDINDALTEEAKRQAQVAGADDKGEWLYLPNGPVVVSIDAKVGDKKNEFSVKASGKIVTVYFSKEEAAKLAAAKFNLIIPDDKELSEFKPESITYSFDNYDAPSGSATIKAAFNGVMILKSDSEVIDPAQLVNLNAEQIGTYLRSQAEVKTYELKFSPSFIQKAPSLVDRIKVEVKTE